MRWHRNVRNEFNEMISVYAEIDRDYASVDLTYIEQNRRKAKFNRLLSCIHCLIKDVPEFKTVLAGTQWEVPYTSFKYVANDLFNVVEQMRQNSGASYLVKVRDTREMAVRFVAVKSLVPTEIRDAIIKNFGLEEYGIELSRWCGSRKKYWQ